MRKPAPIFPVSLSLLLLPLLAGACADLPFDESSSRLVVEGWIDEGGFPVVFVTTSVPFTSTDKSRLDLSDHVLKWAKVSVSDGEHTVVLTGRMMRDYPTRYGFTSGLLRGQSGRTYRLTVDYADRHAEAVTTVPQRAEVARFELKPHVQADGDTLYALAAHAHGLRAEEGAYKFFLRQHARDGYYLSCNMGLYAAQGLEPEAVMPVLQPHRLKLSKDEDYSPYFTARDTVYVKFAHLDAVSQRFWKSYEDHVSLEDSPFFASGSGLQGNVAGALGYWCGYGSSEYVVSIPDSLAK